MGISEWLIPQEKIFFEYLEKQIENVLQGSLNLKKLVSNYKNVGISLRRIKKIEHEGDRIVHNFYHKLNSTFITPIDNEDLTLLVSSFDDILDRCYAVTNRLYYFKIKTIPKEIVQFVSIIDKQLTQIKYAVFRIRRMEQREIDKCCVEIHRLENLGDELFDKTAASLFEKEDDVKKIIKLREIYALLEEISDKCEDAAIAIREIVIKNS